MTTIKPRTFSAAFTIVELLIVIAVIGILVTIVSVSYSSSRSRAIDVSVLSDLDAMDGIQTHYGLKNSVSGKEWYSGSGYDNSLAFSPSSGNVIDVVIDNSDYCIRGYNTGGSYNSINNAATKESSPGVCATLGPSIAAGGSGTPTPPIAWWKLNGNANDSSGNGNNGTVFGATPTTGQNGQSNGAYSFNGLAGTGILATIPSVGISNVTITAWAYVQNGTTKGTIAHVGLGDGYSIGVGDGFNSTNARFVGLFPAKRWIITPTIISTGWHLFSIVLDSSSIPRLFLDNTDLGQFSGTNPFSPSNQMSIGRNTGDEGSGSGSERIYNNTIDDVRIYNYVLSLTEISTLYSTGAQ